MTVSRLAGGACGALAALYLLTGRWTLSRLSGEHAAAQFFTEVRFWVVLLLAGASLLVDAPPLASSRRRGAPAVVLLFGLFYYLVASAAWAPDPELAWHKAYDVMLVAAATFALARALASGESECVLRWMWSGILAIAGTLAAVALASLIAHGTTGERLAVLGGGPNTFARIMGLLALAALFFWSRRGLSWVFMPLVSVAIVLVLLSGSRGGFVALVAAVVVFVAFQARKAGRLLGGSLVAGTVFALATSYTAVGRAALETFERRITQLLLQEQYTAGRDELYRSAYELAMKAPVFGDGLAAFPARGLGVYPHNLFLEAFCEAGIVGVALVVATLAAAGGAALRRTEPTDRAAVAGLVFMLVASQFSGDLYDSRALFAFVILATVRPRAALPAHGEVDLGAAVDGGIGP
jgi:O-antigen ligase